MRTVRKHWAKLFLYHLHIGFSFHPLLGVATILKNDGTGKLSSICSLAQCTFISMYLLPLCGSIMYSVLRFSVPPAVRRSFIVRWLWDFF